MSRIKATIVKRNEEGNGNLRAICDVNISGIVTIHGARLVEGKNGMFVSMPQEKWVNGDGVTKYSEIVSMATPEIKDEIFSVVMAQYNTQNQAQSQPYTEEELAIFENLR